MVARAVLAGLLLAAAPCLADESPVPGALDQVGLLGTWAIDCAQPASPTDEYAVYSASSSGAATLAYTRGAPYRDIVYVVESAERRPDDRLALRVSRRTEKIVVDLVLVKTDNTIRVWSSHGLDGRMLVIDGIITGDGAESPSFQRCAP
jgi:hypothetical protein